jgi:mono/diheme cytochrome c family protein
VEPSVIGEGLNPRPPDLGGAGLSRQEAARAFWVIQHGLRMTGMPAFGPTHDDDELWAIVAFLDRLGRISPEEYARAIAHQEAADPSPGSAGHDGHDHRH